MSGMSISQFMSKPTKKERLEKLRRSEEKLEKEAQSLFKLFIKITLIYIYTVLFLQYAPTLFDTFKQVLDIGAIPLGGFPK